MKPFVKVALGLVLLLALTGILAALYLYNKQHADTSKARPDFVVSATDLHKEFTAGEAAATARYGGKIVEVTGTITAVRSDDKATTISLDTSDPMSSVMCTLATLADDNALKIGDKVTIRGECSGFLMDVLLNNCTIIGNNE